jgi:hypothetical protein
MQRWAQLCLLLGPGVGETVGLETRPVGDKVTVGSIVIRIQHTVSKATDAVERITASYLPVGGGEDGAGVGEADAVGGVAVGVAVSAVVGMAVGVVVGAVVDVAVGAEVGNVVGVDV